MRKLLVSTLALGITLTSCGSAEKSAAPSVSAAASATTEATTTTVAPTTAAPTTTVATTTTLLPMAGCEAKGNPNVNLGANAPSTSMQLNPNGPYFHKFVGALRNGQTLGATKLLVDHAGVPDAAKFKDGRILAYYVNGEPGGGLWMAEVAPDLSSAKPLGRVKINGVASPQGAVDPDVTVLADGTFRLLYLNTFGPAPAAGQPPRDYVMCFADSKNGTDFTVVGKVLSFSGVETTDPSLVQLADGSWLISVYQAGKTVIAKSSDGLRFAVIGTHDIGGVAELAREGDALRIFSCKNGGINMSRSTDGGATWKLESTVVKSQPGKIACDPSLVPGTNLFLYKTADAPK